MLTPEYLASCSDYLLGICDVLQQEYVTDIASRLIKAGKMTSSARWQARQLQESGMVLKDAQKRIAAAAGMTEEEIARLFKDAGLKSMENDAKPLIDAGRVSRVSFSPAMQQLLNATIAKVTDDVKNLTLTTSVSACNDYLEAANMAYMKVVTGGWSYSQAIADAVRTAAKSGNKVMFKGGGTSNLDVAVRRSVLTGVNQTAAKMTELYSEDLGVEYYEVTAHYGARPSHAVWQGKVYKINGSEPGYPNFAESTGYGTGAGLCGWNCRHSFFPYWPGISKPAYSRESLLDLERKRYTYNGQELTEYECSQVQRSYERQIRESKRMLAGFDAAAQAATDRETRERMLEEFQSESVKLKAKERELRRFCNATNRSVDSVRTQVAAFKDSNGNIVRFGRSTSSKAVWASKKANTHR